MIDWDNKEISIKRQAELLKVRRASLYYKPVGISDEELALMNAIDRIYTKWPAFGYRRITAILHEEGYRVNRKRVRRLMRKMGISTICPGPNLSRRNKQHHTYPYLLRNLEVVRPNQVWGVDVTYIPMKNGWIYLFAVIEWPGSFPIPSIQSLSSDA